MGGFSESKYSTLTMLYRNPFKIFLYALGQDMIQPLGIDFSPFHYKTGSFEKLNLTILVLQSMESKQSCNQFILKITSKLTI